MPRRRRYQEEKPDYYTQREWNRIMQREAAQKKASLKLFLVFILMLALVAAAAYFVYHQVFASHDTDLNLGFDAWAASVGGESAEDLAKAEPFAAGLCVTDGDVDANAVFITATEGALFDRSNEEVLYAKNIFEQRSPASITKVMTALVAMKYGNVDDMVTVTSTAFDIEEGSSVCELNLGDRLSLKQLLYGLLIASGNDAAMMIAEHVGGSVDAFVALMNQEALALGATHTNFMNPHGLTADGHYTCAYDIYLMMNEAMSYDLFMDIIQRKNYYAEYTDASGDAYAMTWETTDHYLTGEAAEPDNVIIYGGKTGTTDDAGACLALITKDLYGNPYISVIMNSESKESLYPEMNQILSLVPA